MEEESETGPWRLEQGEAETSNARPSCSEVGLKNLGKEHELYWQDASFTVAKEQLVGEFFFGQGSLEVEAAEDSSSTDDSLTMTDSPSASDSSRQSSPIKSRSCSAEVTGNSRDRVVEYGRRAVFVVLTGGHTKPAVPLTVEAKEVLHARAKEVEDLLNKWQPSVIHTSTIGKKVRLGSLHCNIDNRMTIDSNIVQVRLDAIFLTSSNARGAFKAVHGHMRSRTSPSRAACCLVEEEDLGYNLAPVLTESQLLRLQSAKLCMNVFLTFLPIKVVSNSEGEIEYHFNSVADVNMFLFRTQASKDERSKGKGLGYLVRDDNELKTALTTDEDNFYKLFTEHKTLPEQVTQFSGLHSSPIKAGVATVGHLLLFSTKLRMFEFLVSSEARQLGHLQFHEELLTTEAVQRVPKYPQGVDELRTEANSLKNLRGGDAEEKCERLELLLKEKESETKVLEKLLAEAKVAVTEANAELMKEVKERENVEKQLDEIHQLSFNSSFLE